MKKIMMGICIVFLWSCGPSKKTSQTNEIEKQALVDMVQNGSMEIQARWARPLLTSSLASIANAGLLAPGNTVSQINLMGNPAYLRVVGDSVSAYLPYYGERQMVTSYGNTDNAIQFDGTPSDFELREDDKSDGYVLNFNINSDMETYTVFAKIFPGMRGTININSTHRRGINYTGVVSTYQEE